MNVNPVAQPGAASTVQAAAKADSQPAAISGAGRGDGRQRSTASIAVNGSGPATVAVDQDDRAISADRQKAAQLRAFIGDASVRLNTYHDEASGRSILEIRDQVTGDVVSQYPSEELIRLYASLRETLVDQSA